MIFCVTPARVTDLRTLANEKNLYACKIACLFDSYGLSYPFARFWLQYDGTEPVTAIAAYYGDYTVQATAKTDVAELTEFLQMTGFSSVLSEREIFSDSYSGIVMEKAPPHQNVKAESNPDWKEVYRLLQSCQSDTFEVPAYEDFLLDMSHKIRHGTALCVGVHEKDKLAATAMTIAQSKHCAVIGAVATKPAFRHSGYGGQCVKALCSLLHDRSIFIMRDEGENEHFYQSLGFENKGKFYIKRGKNHDTVLSD